LAYYRLQEYPEALAAFGAVLDSYGNTPDVAADAAFNRGMAFKRMRRDADAIKAYNDVISRWPESDLANMSRIRIGYIHEDAKEYDLAIAAYRALASSDQGKLGAEALYLVGDCYLAQKKTGEALLAYREVETRFKGQDAWVVTALAKVGEVEESQGQDGKALQAYEKIISLGGDPSWIKSAQNRIEAIRARMPQPAPKAKPQVKPKPKSKPKSAPEKKGAKK
jgi:TolA-binding protein